MTCVALIRHEGLREAEPDHEPSEIWVGFPDLEKMGDSGCVEERL